MNNLETLYYHHTCKCGCGEKIIIRERHKRVGIPIYVYGHNRKGKQQTKELRKKIKENHSRYWKGKSQTQEHKIKNSENRKDKYLGEENHQYGKHSWNFGLTKESNIIILLSFIKNSKIKKGQISPFKGKQHTEEAKSKNRESHIGLFKGELSPNWNGGTSFEPYSPEFNKELKDFIKERDNYTCQCPNCEVKSSKLDIHHIDYDKTNNNPENLLVLCKSCHMKTNPKSKRNYYTELYQNIMNKKLIDILT